MNKRQAKKKWKKEISKTLAGVTVYKEKVEPRVIIHKENKE